jgi:hypothetical protein
MALILSGDTGVPVTTVTGTLPVANGGSGVTTSTGTGANVLGTSPTITGLTFTSAATAAPAFSAYNNATQTVTSSTYTKVNLQLEEFDTANCFDNATNYRFTPTVAGYYQVNGQIGYNYTVLTRSIIGIYKNGASFKFGTDGTNGQNTVSALIYMNGSTDYIELYGWINGTGTLQFDNGASKSTYFQASMVRSA